MKVRKSKMKKFTVNERKRIRENNGELPSDLLFKVISKNMELHSRGFNKNNY